MKRPPLDSCVRSLVIAILTFATSTGCTQSETKVAMPTAGKTTDIHSDEIPFTLTKWNNLSVDATINDTDHLKLMFHTDAGSVVVTEEAAKKCNSLRFDKDVPTKSWGGESNSRFCTDNRLQIQGLSWSKVTIFEDLHSGHETDGKFGPSQFDGKIVEIDYQRNVLLIHDSLPEKASAFEKFTFEKQQDSFFVTGSINITGRDVENSFLVHSGFSGAAMLDDQFVADNESLKSLPVLNESQVKDSFGNVLKTKKIVLPSIQFGSMKFTDVPVSIFEGSIGRQKMSLIGGDMLKRFDIILDASDRAIYLRKNRLQDAKFFAG